MVKMDRAEKLVLYSTRTMYQIYRSITLGDWVIFSASVAYTHLIDVVGCHVFVYLQSANKKCHMSREIFS